MVIGQPFTVQSKALGDTQRFIVYLPLGYADSATLRLFVLYLGENFLHIAVLV